MHGGKMNLVASSLVVVVQRTVAAILRLPSLSVRGVEVGPFTPG